MARKKASTQTAAPKQATPITISTGRDFSSIDLETFLGLYGAKKAFKHITIGFLEKFCSDPVMIGALPGIDGKATTRVTFDQLFPFIDVDKREEFKKELLAKVGPPESPKKVVREDKAYRKYLEAEGYDQETVERYYAAFKNSHPICQLLTLKSGRKEFYDSVLKNQYSWMIHCAITREPSKKNLELLVDLDIKLTTDQKIRILNDKPENYLEFFDDIPYNAYYSYSAKALEYICKKKAFFKIKNKTFLRSILSKDPKVLEQLSYEELESLAFTAKELLLFASRQKVSLKKEYIDDLKKTFMVEVMMSNSRSTTHSVAAINKLEDKAVDTD